MAARAVRGRAVLETSFWTAAYRAEIAANCLDLFEIVVPRAVEAEIRSIDPADPRREYPSTTLFRHLRGQLLDPPPEVPTPLARFGPGRSRGHRARPRSGPGSAHQRAPSWWLRGEPGDRGCHRPRCRRTPARRGHHQRPGCRPEARPHRADHRAQDDRARPARHRRALKMSIACASLYSSGMPS